MASKMTDEEWDHYVKTRDVREANNKKLEGAAYTGNLEVVKHISTSPEYKGLVEVDCNHNYPLSAACLKGHVHVIDFLVNFPDEEIRNKITTPERIRAAIRCSAEYNQPPSFLYFKEHFPTEYAEVVNSKDARWGNQAIGTLTARGQLETIELLMAELPKDFKFDYAMYISSSIQYDKMDCFDYFMNLATKKDLSQKTKQEDLIHTALYREKFDCLDRLIKMGVINLNKNLTTQHFRILVESKFESLVHIVHKYDYKPNEKLMGIIMDCVNKKEEYDLRTCVIRFVNMLDKHQLKQKLDEEIEVKTQSNKPFKRKI